MSIKDGYLWMPFHKAWEQAKTSPDYDESIWLELKERVEIVVGERDCHFKFIGQMRQMDDALLAFHRDVDAARMARSR